MRGQYEGPRASAVGRILDGAGAAGTEAIEADLDLSCDVEEEDAAARGVLLGMLLGSALWAGLGFTASAIQTAWLG